MSADHNRVEGPITEKVIISDLLEVCPEAEGIIGDLLGESALFIPGARTESLEFICAMHDFHYVKLLDALNKVCKVHPGKIGHF